MGQAADAPEELRGSLAGGVFFRCDPRGLRLLSETGALADCLGVGLEELRGKLGATLGREAPTLYSELFDPSSEASGPATLPYLHPVLGERWLSLSLSPAPTDGTGRLVFLRDETVLHEAMVKVAASQSKDVENSARLQAAVLMEGQRRVLPRLDYQTTTVPSKLVDGDFLDVLRLSGSSVDFLLGDVMGKGMEAAILGAMIKFSFVRALSGSLYGLRVLPDPAEICCAVDSAVASRLLERQSFATLTYARYEEETRTLRFVDCGHTSIIHHSGRTGECWRVKGGNMPLGFTENQAYRSFVLPLDPGDSLLLYTDGLSECCNRWGEALGEERVAYLLRTYSALPAAELAGTILKIGFAYSAAGFNDDVSLVCIKDRGEGGGEARESSLSLELEAESFEALGEAEAGLGRDLDGWLPGLEGALRSEILLALHEALANILEHGLAGGRGGCELRWRLVSDLLVVELAYQGLDYDWAKSPASPLAAYADSGYGRLIMDRAMDSLLVAQGFHGKKRLVMCRSLPRRMGPGAAAPEALE